MTKHLLYIPLLLLAFTSTSCKKVSEDIQRDAIITDSVDFEIPILSEIDSAYTLSDIKLPLNPGAAISAQLPDFNESNIKSIKLTKMSLGLSPLKGAKDKDSIDVNNHFGNFQSIRFTIPGTPAAGSSTASPLLIASAIINSTSVSGALSMTPDTELELKPYVGANAANSTVTIRTRKVTNKVVKVRVRASFTVTVSK